MLHDNVVKLLKLDKAAEPPSPALDNKARDGERVGETYDLKNASKSALITSGWVVAMPCGRPG